jgi:hypothetical protein
MAVLRARSIEQLSQSLRDAPPPTDDDMTVLSDGRRIDSREARRASLYSRIAQERPF